MMSEILYITVQDSLIFHHITPRTFPQYTSEGRITKNAEERGGHGGVWPVRVFLASRDLIRVKRLEPGASQ